MWTVGIDPGLKETGIAVLDEQSLREVVTIKAAPASEASDLERTMRLGMGVANYLEFGALDKLPRRREVLIVIEYPIMKASNVVNYRKQCSVVQAIEMQLAQRGIGHKLLEVSPTEAKLWGAGNGAASKAEIIAASPLSGSGHTIETMADAWMIARAGECLLMAGSQHHSRPVTIPRSHSADSWYGYATHASEIFKERK